MKGIVCIKEFPGMSSELIQIIELDIQKKAFFKAREWINSHSFFYFIGKLTGIFPGVPGCLMRDRHPVPANKCERHAVIGHCEFLKVSHF
jgi:hypothetical protein